ncbi:unnamed protein product [marine sediment metagenome]|uniref:Uncharacterized protein n=1 Tax=marine sediment metagenome TaxID=412755 RepID=X1JB43_9ZZZZ
MDKKTHIVAGVCRQCGKNKYLSVRGLCYSCGIANRRLAANEMRARQGPIFERWQASMIKSGNKILQDIQLARERKQKLADSQRQMMEQQ